MATVTARWIVSLTFNDQGDCGCLPGWGPDCSGECADLALKGDGTCHEGAGMSVDFHCAVHDYDGGDCAPCPEGEPRPAGAAARRTPSATVSATSPLNCAKNGNDSGDCCPEGQIGNCNGGCTTASWIQDNICDSSLNCAMTGYDGGDCECPAGHISDCVGFCFDEALKGDGTCNAGAGPVPYVDFFCDAHAYDGGDCTPCEEGLIADCMGVQPGHHRRRRL